MGNPQDYQKVAAECLVLLRVSRLVTDPQSKAMLLHMAASWIRLAERAKEEGRQGGSLSNAEEKGPCAKAEAMSP